MKAQGSFWGVIGFFLLASILFFWPSFSLGFLADDFDFLDHVFLAQETPRPWWTLVTTSIGGISFYRPVVNLSFGVDEFLYGQNATGFHVTNALLFGLAVGLFVVLCQRIFKNFLAGVIAGLLFLVSPFTAESVMWIAGRTDLLMLVFLLASVETWIRFRETEKNFWLVLVVVFFILALGSKENSIVLPALVFLVDRGLFWRKIQEHWQEKKFWIVSLPYLLIIALIGGFFFARWRILGHAVSSTNEFGDQTFAFFSFRQVEYFYHYYVRGIAHADMFFQWGISYRGYYGLYALAVFSSIILFVRNFSRTWKIALTGLVIHLVFALLVWNFALAINDDHLNMRFLLAPSLGFILGFVGVLTVFEPLQKFRLAQGLTLGVFGILWLLASLYQRGPYAVANAEWEQFVKTVGTEVVPTVQKISKPGILFANLPGNINGVFVAPAHLQTALRLRYPEFSDATIQNYGVRPVTNSVICEMFEGKRPLESLFAFLWQKDVKSFLTWPVADLTAKVVSGPTVIETWKQASGKPLSFPTDSSDLDWQPWTYTGVPFQEHYREWVLPVQNVRGKLGKNGATIRLNMHFYSTIDPVRALPKRVTQQELDAGEIRFPLCAYPGYYNTTPVTSIQVSFRGFEGVEMEFGTPYWE